MLTVTKIFTFDAAHHLPFHGGKCANVHGHTYKLEVSVTGPVNLSGMVVDFGVLKEEVNVVLEQYDHHDLNELVSNPTAENLLHRLYKDLEYRFALMSLPKISKLRLWETPTCYVEESYE